MKLVRFAKRATLLRVSKEVSSPTSQKIRISFFFFETEKKGRMGFDEHEQRLAEVKPVHVLS